MKKVLLVAFMGMVCQLGISQDSTRSIRDVISVRSDTTKLGIGDSTRPSVKGKSGQRNVVKVKFTKRKKNHYFGLIPTFEFGWNRFMDNGSLSISSDNKDLRLDKGPEFAFYPIGGGVYLNKSHSLKLSAMMGLTWNTYHFEKDITLLKGQDQLSYVIDNEHHFSKNLLRSQYLSMPILFSVYPAGGTFDINAGV